MNIVANVIATIIIGAALVIAGVIHVDLKPVIAFTGILIGPVGVIGILGAYASEKIPAWLFVLGELITLGVCLLLIAIGYS